MSPLTVVGMIDEGLRGREAPISASPAFALVASDHLPLLNRVAWPPARIVIADGDPVSAMAAHVATSDQPLLAVATAAEVDDRLLFAMLDIYQSFAESDRPFAEAPRAGLIIGRDLGVLERNLGKAMNPPPARADRTELVLFTPNRPEHRVATLALPYGRQPGFEIAEVALRLEALEAAYARPVAAAAIATHGFDSCADGGDGAVLCGLRRDRDQPPPGAPGYLACGHGVACPRGPRPLRLSGFGANILMVAACNGLRARDSVLTNDFNLALEFAEGPGEGYASTVFGAQGNLYAATAFLAALASGHDLCSATLLANMLLSRGGLERTAYLPVGQLGSTPSAQAPTIIDLRGSESRSVRIESPAHCIELRLDGPIWLDLHKQGRLGLSAEQSTPGPVFWFARMVQAGPEQRPYLELFLFGFPHPLDGLTIEAWDLNPFLDEAAAGRQGLARWLELGRLNDPELNDAWEAASNQLDHIRRELIGCVRAAAYSVTDRSVSDRLLTNLRETVLLVRKSVSDEIVGKLSNTFWLSNVLAEEYRLADHADSRCAACGGIAIQKSLLNIASSERRTIIVCARCGIVSDLRAGGPFRAVQFNAPLVGFRGEQLRTELEIRLEKDVCLSELDVQVRLSTLGQLTGEPIEQIALSAKNGVARYRLDFALPPALRPHRFFIKAFVSTAHDFAFGSHVFFVN